MSLLLALLAGALTLGGLTLTAAPANAATDTTPVFSDTAGTIVVTAGQYFENRDFVPVAPSDLSNITVDMWSGDWYTTLTIAKDGTISGYVPAGRAFDATLFARNDDTGQYTTHGIHVISQQPAQLFAPSSASVTAGQPSTIDVYAWGFPTPTLTAESLPDGMALTAQDDSHWTISGTPATGTVGVHHVTVRATADGMPDVTQPIDLTVAAPAFDSSPTPTLSNVDTPHVGDALTVDPGTVNPQPDALSYQWYRNGDAIDGATTPSYDVIPADAGTRLKVAVTAHKTGYSDASGTYESAPVLPGDQAEPSAPQIGGTLTVGHTLSVDPGTAAPEADTITYQWLRDGTDILGATDGSYQLGAADAGHHVTATVTRHRAGYRDKITDAATVGTVARGTLALTPTPDVTGIPQVGNRLSAELDPTTVTYLDDLNSDGSQITYQWLRDGEGIDDATSDSYTATATDAGHDLSVKATVTVDGYDPATGTSTPARVANATFASVPVPTVSGTATVGQQLTVHQDATTPAAQHTTYQWLRDGAAIAAATGETYTATAADLGHVLAVTATVTADGYDTATATSDSTGEVVRGILAFTPAPSLAGVSQVGGRLSADLDATTIGYLTDLGALEAVTYQWLRDGEQIGGATSDSYNPTAVDAGHDVSVDVTVTVDGYDPVNGTSTVARVVNAAFAAVPVPTVSGAAKVGQQLAAHQGATTPTAQHTTYRWLRDGREITGAAGDTYTATHADLGHLLAVTTTVTAPGYDAVSTSSAPTAKVAPNAAPSVALHEATTHLVIGHSTTLRWSTTDADSVSLSGTSPTRVAASGTRTVKPTRVGRHTYTLTATNTAGTTTAVVTLDVALPAAKLHVTSDRRLVLRNGVVKVAASGLNRGERYTLTLGGARVASGAASTTGHLTRTVRVPRSAAAGNDSLVVTGSQQNRTGSVKVQVLTAKHLTLIPASRIVRASHVTSATVAGLAAGERVVVTYRGVKVSGAHAHANVHGRYSVRFNVRRDWGWRVLSAHGAGSTRSATTRIAVYPYDS